MAGCECLYSDHRLLPGVAKPCVAIAAIGGAEQLLDALFGLLHRTTARATPRDPAHITPADARSRTWMPTIGLCEKAVLR